MASRYDNAFPPASRAMPCGEGEGRGIFSSYLIRVPNAGRVIDALRQRGILAQRPVEHPLHSVLGLRSQFPMSDAAYTEIVSLPIYPSLHDRAVERIIEETSRLLV